EHDPPHSLCLLRPRGERPRGSRAAECGQQFPPSDGDCHTPLPREGAVKGTVSRHERTVFAFKEGGVGRCCKRASAYSSCSQPPHRRPRFPTFRMSAPDLLGPHELFARGKDLPAGGNDEPHGDGSRDDGIKQRISCDTNEHASENRSKGHVNVAHV